MRVLFVQLLRLGDVLMNAPVIEAFKLKYPHARVDLLTNKECLKAKDFIPSVEQFHVFDRIALQSVIADESASVLQAHDELLGLIQKLNAQKYDLIVNLTQNRLSGYLCRMIEASEKIGMVLDANDRVEFGNRWFRFLNSEISERTVFHYNDIFLKALDLPVPRPQVEYKSSNTVAFQALTSDAKKHWSPQNTAHFCRDLIELGKKVVLLGTPEEEGKLKEILALTKTSGEIKILICTLPEAFELLKTVSGLVTFDTSIKHLAVLARTPLVEVALGPADPRKNGPYISGAHILTSSVPCAPCSARGFCPHLAQLCGEEVFSDRWAQSVVAYFAGQSPARGLVTDLTNWAHYVLRPTTMNRVEIENLIEQSAVRIWLSSSHHGFEELGTEVYRLYEGLLKSGSWDKQKSIFSLRGLTKLNTKSMPELHRREVANIVVNFKELRQLQQSFDDRQKLFEIKNKIIGNLSQYMPEGRA